MNVIVEREKRLEELERGSADLRARTAAPGDRSTDTRALIAALEKNYADLQSDLFGTSQPVGARQHGAPSEASDR